MRLEFAVPLFQFFVGHHRIDRRTLETAVSQDIHHISGAATLVDDAVTHVVPETVGIQVRQLGLAGVGAENLGHPADLHAFTGMVTGRADKERIQVFEGAVISRANGGNRATFTVRKISYGVGVERIFPLHSPRIDKIEVVARGRVRRAKLYYLRELSGKAARIKGTRVQATTKSRAAASAPAPEEQPGEQA